MATRPPRLKLDIIVVFLLCVWLWWTLVPGSSSSDGDKPASPAASKQAIEHDSEVYDEDFNEPLLLEEPNALARPLLAALRRIRTNPLDQYRPPQHDSHFELKTRQLVFAANKTSTLSFMCTHSDIKALCPAAYRVLFVGPTLNSPTYADSSDRRDARRVDVAFTIADPGTYEVYAWPEHLHCDLWQDSEKPYNKVLVGGAPFRITIEGDQPDDATRACTADEALAGTGRWVSKAHVNPIHLSDVSDLYPWLEPQMLPTSAEDFATLYSYFHTPYECKIPHRTLPEWIDFVRPTSLVVFGDSVLRDYFCLILHRGLGGPKEGACKYSDSPDYHNTDKTLSYVRSDGGTSLLRFVWLPAADSAALTHYISRQSSKPSHILFGVSLWLATDPPDVYVKKMKVALELVREWAPAAKMLVRTSAGAVQSIQCYDRVGGQRRQLELLNEALLALLAGSPSMHAFHAYPIFNDHPASSSDGRHWGAVGHEGDARPEVGSAEFALTDRMFHAWSTMQ